MHVPQGYLFGDLSHSMQTTKLLLSPDSPFEFECCCLLLAVCYFLICVLESYNTDQIELKRSGQCWKDSDRDFGFRFCVLLLLALCRRF